MAKFMTEQIPAAFVVRFVCKSCVRAWGTCLHVHEHICAGIQLSRAVVWPRAVPHTLLLRPPGCPLPSKSASVLPCPEMMLLKSSGGRIPQEGVRPIVGAADSGPGPAICNQGLCDPMKWGGKCGPVCLRGGDTARHGGDPDVR